MCIGFGLIHVFSIEQEQLISCSLLLHTLINWILLPISHLTLMSFCTQGLPGVAESTVSKSEGKQSPWREGAGQGGWGVEERVFVRPSPTVCDGPPSPGARVILWMMGSATLPSATRRMTGWGWQFYFRVTNHKGVWWFVYGGLIYALCSGFGMMLFLLVIDWFMSLIKNKGSSFGVVCSCIL